MTISKVELPLIYESSMYQFDIQANVWNLYYLNIKKQLQNTTLIIAIAQIRLTEYYTKLNAAKIS